METIKLNVNGMSCGGCSSRLRKVLEKQDGVASASASHEDNTCVIEFDPGRIGKDKLVAVIEGANFTVEG
jgi:copper chaperone